MHRSSVYVAVRVVIALAAACESTALPTDGSRGDGDGIVTRNIVMIAVDDLNDFVSPLGGSVDVLKDPKVRARATPNLDRLATMGVTFTCAQTAHPACNASRAAVMVGVSGETSGMTANDGGLNWRNYDAIRYAVTLPQHLKSSRGYTIKTSGKVWHNNQSDLATDRRGQAPPSTDRAYTDWDAAPSFRGGPLQTSYRRTAQQWTIGRDDRVNLRWSELVPIANGVDDRSPEAFARLTDAMSDQRTAIWAADQIQSHPTGERPLFLAVGIFHPHLPWEAPAHFFERFPLDQVSTPKVLATDLEDLPHVGRRMGIGSVHPQVISATPGSDLAWRTVVRAYLASVAFADHAVGKVLDAVESKNRDDDPSNDWSVVLWSDHGWHLGEKQVWHKFTVWEEAARSNLMVYAPGVTRPGQRIDTPVDLLAIAPTIFDLAGADPLPQLQGESLLPLIRGDSDASDAVALTTFGETERGDGFHAKKYALRSERFRFIHYQDGEQELYDCEKDPDCFYNLLSPINAAVAFHYGLTAVTIDHIRRWHGSRLLERLITLRSEDVRRGKVSLADIDSVGSFYSQEFENDAFSDSFETGMPPANPKVRDGHLHAPPGDRFVAVLREPVLRKGQSFLFSADVALDMNAGTGGGVGLVIGVDPRMDGWEWLLTSGAADADDSAPDAVLARVAGRERTSLLVGNSIRRLRDPSGAPSDFSAGPYRLIMQYSAERNRIGVQVLNSYGVCQYRADHVLGAPIPSGSRFGLVSRDARGGTTWENVLLYVEDDAISLGGPIAATSSKSSKQTE